MAEKEESINKLFPVFLKLEQLHVLVVGGGYAAYEKLTAILSNSPRTSVRLVSKNFSNELLTLVKDHSNIEVHEREYKTEDIRKADIVIAATGNTELSHRIREEAHAQNILVNIADTLSLCDFYLGSVVSKGDLKIAISTNGKSPTFAKRLRQYLESVISSDILLSLKHLGKLRATLKGDFNDKVKQLNKATEVLVSGET